MTHRPLVLTILGALQFAGFGAACIVLLGHATLDGELSPGDVAAAVAVAVVGAVVVGATMSGGRVGWWFELALAVAAVGLGAAWTTADDPPVPGPAVLAAGVVWLAFVAQPHARAWFLRPVQ